MLTNSKYHKSNRDPDTITIHQAYTEPMLWSSPLAPSQAYYARIVLTSLSDPNDPTTLQTFELILHPNEAIALADRLLDTGLTAITQNQQYNFIPSPTLPTPIPPNAPTNTP